MSKDQHLLLKILRLLAEKTRDGRVVWAESPRVGRFLAVVNGQTFTLTSSGGEEGEPASVTVQAVDEAGRSLWSVWADDRAPEEDGPPREIGQAVYALEEAVDEQVADVKVSRMERSLEGLASV